MNSLKYILEVTEEEARGILFDRYTEQRPWYMKALPFVLLIIAAIIGALSLEPLDNDWIAVLIFVACCIPVMIFFFWFARKSRNHVDVKVEKLELFKNCENCIHHREGQPCYSLTPGEHSCENWKGDDIDGDG